MRKALLVLLGLALCASSFAQDTGPARRIKRGEAAGFSSRNATVLSILGWAVGLTVGIAAICALIENETGTTVHFH